MSVDLGLFRLHRLEPTPLRNNYPAKSKEMKIHACFWALAIIVSCLLRISNSAVDQEAKEGLIGFLEKLSNYDSRIMLDNEWRGAYDPCIDSWSGVVCRNNTSITKLFLNQTGLSGILDVSLLCNVRTISRTLSILFLDGNKIRGSIAAGISMCHQLTHLNIGRNQLSGFVPDSIGFLKNLKRLDISHNSFIGQLPDLSRISGLNVLAVEFNGLSGRIPTLDFSNLDYFNVSYNNFSGVVQDIASYFNETSFYGNPLLCGHPLKKTCPKTGRGVSHECSFMYAGYTMLFLALLAVVFMKLYKRQRKTKRGRNQNKVATDENEKKCSGLAIEIKTEATKSETSGTPVATTPVESRLAEGASISQLNSLVILSTQATRCMTLDELLRAPAELLGRGKYANLYRVEYRNGMAYAVKRIREWEISHRDFTERIQRIDQVKHPNVLPVVAFYSSKQEQLLVYEYQRNGSLLGLLQDKKEGRELEWGFRLEIAAKTVDALAHLHHQLRDDGVGHGNLKSSNIILNEDMEPCISEYGLKEMSENDLSSYPLSLAFLQGMRPDQRSTAESDPSADAFQRDVYNFGLILLELLTGRVVQSNTTFNLTKWVHSVVQEEWTVEVFDKSLVSEGASEEGMVYLLQVALKCVNKSPDARPTSSRVASMINMIKEEEERAFLAYEP